VVNGEAVGMCNSNPMVFGSGSLTFAMSVAHVVRATTTSDSSMCKLSSKETHCLLSAAIEKAIIVATMDRRVSEAKA
jgi:hypothetical protein